MKLNQEWYITVDDPLLGNGEMTTIDELAQLVVRAYHESCPQSVVVNPLRHGLLLFLLLQDQGLPVSRKSFASSTPVT